MGDERSDGLVDLLSSSFGIRHVFHATPLHYLPFIARARCLLARPKLQAHGYQRSHFRSTSHSSDVARGFGDRVFLSMASAMPLLQSKLGRGFPHIRLDIPLSALERTEFDLCRYNVAKNRSNLRHQLTFDISDGQANGRYYPGKQLPVARSFAEKKVMLRGHGTKRIEVQVKDVVSLPNGVTVTCFSQADQVLADQIVGKCDCHWKTMLEVGNYPRSERFGKQVETFCRRALSEPDWKGDGLEFDYFP